MIYLATPYSYNPERGFSHARQAAVYLLFRGEPVFSPILHWHNTAAHFSLPGDASFWWNYNRQMLSIADNLVVYAVDSWETSTGVQQEISWWHAHRPNSPVRYIYPNEVQEII